MKLYLNFLYGKGLGIRRIILSYIGHAVLYRIQV